MPVCKKCGKDMFLKNGEWVCDCEEQDKFNEELEDVVEEEMAEEGQQAEEQAEPEEITGEHPEEEYKEDEPPADEPAETYPAKKDYSDEEKSYAP